MARETDITDFIGFTDLFQEFEQTELAQTVKGFVCLETVHQEEIDIAAIQSFDHGVKDLIEICGIVDETRGHFCRNFDLIADGLQSLCHESFRLLTEVDIGTVKIIDAVFISCADEFFRSGIIHFGVCSIPCHGKAHYAITQCGDLFACLGKFSV